MHSEQINELATALAKAQGQMKAAPKDAVNPHLKNNYATLSSYIEAARGALSTNNLAFSQILSQAEEGVVLETMLLHSSGQWLQSEVLIRVATDNRGINGVQALGSALTYYKRYALAAMLGISVADDDDDGNGVEQPAKKATTPQTRQETPKQPAKPNIDQSTGEVIEPAKKPVQTQEAPKPNGNGKPQGKIAENPDTLFAKVQKATNGYYEAKEHLYNTLKPAGGWPNFNDPDDIDAKISIAVDHANQKRQQEAEPVAEDQIPF